MDKFSIISAQQIIKTNYKEHYIYGYELKGAYRASFEKPFYSDYIIIVTVLRGKLSYTFGDRTMTIEQGQFSTISFLNPIDSIRYSADFHGLAVAASKLLISDIFLNKNHFPPAFRMRFAGQHQTLALSFREQKIIAEDIHRLIGALGNKEHRYSIELNYAHFYILLTDIANALWNAYGNDTDDLLQGLPRPKYIFRQFIKLVDENIEKESSVQFYADKLCISKQYLSLAVKENTGESVGSVLSRIRFEQAVRLLRGPSVTIQQVADRLGFADQSSFGKFFKKHEGVSPLQYRKAARDIHVSGNSSVSEKPEMP